MSLIRIAAPLLLICLAACEQQSAIHSEAAVSDHPNDAAAAKATVPAPVKAFEMLCYRTNASYSKVVDMAKVLGYPDLPKKLMAVLGPMTGSGKGFVVVNDKKKSKVILLGVNDRNACSIYSNGYDVQAIRTAISENYHLRQIFRDDTGLQVSEMSTPNGVKGTQGEVKENGMVGVTYSKDPSGSSVTVSFIPPETAKKVVQENP